MKNSKSFKNYQLAVFNKRKKYKEIQGLQAKIGILGKKATEILSIAPPKKIIFDANFDTNKMESLFNQLTSQIKEKGGLNE